MKLERENASLRAELARLVERDEVWRAKKNMLENDLGKAWNDIKSLRAEVAAGAHLVATVGDKNRELENRLALLERVAEAARIHYTERNFSDNFLAVTSFCSCVVCKALRVYDAALTPPDEPE